VVFRCGPVGRKRFRSWRGSEFNGPCGDVCAVEVCVGVVRWEALEFFCLRGRFGRFFYDWHFSVAIGNGLCSSRSGVSIWVRNLVTAFIKSA